MPSLRFWWLPLVLCAGLLVVGCRDVPAQDSGGVLPPEQAAYDVTYYDLNVTVYPAQQRLRGHVTVEADVTDSLRAFVLNLDRRLEVTDAQLLGASGRSLPVERRADAAVARVDRLEAELAEVREAVTERGTDVANEPADRNGAGATNESTDRDEPRVANEPADCGHAAASHRDARTTARNSGRRERGVTDDRIAEGDGRVGDRSRDHDGSLTGEVAAHTDAALADAAAMETELDGDDADDGRSLAERIRRLL